MSLHATVFLVQNNPIHAQDLDAKLHPVRPNDGISSLPKQDMIGFVIVSILEGIEWAGQCIAKEVSRPTGIAVQNKDLVQEQS